MSQFKKVSLTALSLMLGVSGVSHAAAGPELIIEDFVGTIKWSNSAGDVKVTDQENTKNLSIYEGDEFIIDGDVKYPDGDKCSGYRGVYNLTWFGKKKEGVLGGYENLEDLPILTVTLPENAKVTIRNSIVFTHGTPNIAAGDISLRHCGDIHLGDVTGELLVESKGSGDITLGNAETIDSLIKGSGDLEAKNVGTLYSEVRGSGDVKVIEASRVNAEISGSGDLEIDVITDGAKIESSGSSDVDIDQLDGELEYQISGSGDLSIEEIGRNEAHPVTLRSSGSGDISIDRGSISFLSVSASGSSTVDVDATVKDLKARANGSSDIYIDTVTGSSETKSSGSSDIEIDNRS